MDNLYSRFLGIGFRNETSGRENKYLSKSSSAPFYLSFQARQLPTSLSGEIPIKKRNGGITSSDIKVQILEEKIRNLEDKQLKMIQSFNQNNEEKSNRQWQTLQPNTTSPMPLLLLNNKDFQKYNRNLSKSLAINNELNKSRLKFDSHRGLQKQDYTPTTAKLSPLNNTLNYQSIFNRQNKYSKTQYKENKYELRKEDLKEKIKDMKIKNKARNFVDKLDEEIYSPIRNDFNNYMNNLNQNIQEQLKEDNNILNNDIEKLENDFKEIKDMLKTKIKKIEKKQKSNFEKLKNVIKKVGGPKMSKAIENVFEGKNYDLLKAGDEYLANDILNLPEIINNKINEEEMISKENERQLRKQIDQKMNEEYEKKRLIEEMQHRERLKMLEIQREKERIEYLKKLNMLRYQVKKEKEHDFNNYINEINDMNGMNYRKYMDQINKYNNIYYRNNNKFSLGDISKIFLMKKMKNMKDKSVMPFNIGIGNNMSTDEMLKYMLLKNMGIDNNMNDTNNINKLYPENIYNNNFNNNFNNPNNYNYNINEQNNDINNNSNLKKIK